MTALRIAVSVDGAEVLVDGASIGRAPLSDEVFVEPGARTIEARLGGYSTTRQAIEAAKGTAQSVTLTLVVAPQAASSAGLGNVAATSAQPATKGDGSAESEPAIAHGGRSKGLIIAGATVSAAAVGTGILFAALSGSKASDAAVVSEELAKDVVRCPSAAYVTKCGEVRRLEEGRVLFANVALWTLVTGVAVGSGTVIYALIAPKQTSTGVARVQPVAAPNAGGLVLTGAW